jgi:hypothetical protein
MQNNNTTNFQESKFCSNCINFYANPKLGNLCSKCFNETKKTSLTKPMILTPNQTNFLESTPKQEINEIKKLNKTEENLKIEEKELKPEISKPIQVSYLK